ncbi:protein kinase domain-containing protein [Bacillus coahuilensis]
MMMNPTLKKPFNFPPGTHIRGKWHHQSYWILKELGYGANGTVFLVKDEKGERQALKVSDTSYTITSEVNVLKAFSKDKKSVLGPELVDVDDLLWNGKTFSFYVMEYIHGPDLLDFIRMRGATWSPILILQLLSNLDSLHQNGWVFGDLKPENLIISHHPVKIRCIDVGGTTQQGRAIKEFTEFFDRGYWGMGSRKAEPTYDLFAVSMIFLNTAYPTRFQRKEMGLSQLERAIDQKQELHPYKKWMLNGLQGRYSTAKTMRQDLLQIVQKKQDHDRKVRKVHHAQVSAPTNQRNSAPTRQERRSTRQKRGAMTETVLVLSIMSVLYLLYIYGELL